jgi:ElaB/YqjD/DUF883 family membrane-anchored ribosome-binding protein
VGTADEWGTIGVLCAFANEFTMEDNIMATVKLSDVSGSEDYQELSAQIATIKNDIASLTELLGDIGARRKDETVEAAKARAERLRENASAQFSDAQVQASEARDQALDAIRRQPGTSIAVAVGIGFLAGILTGRR